MLQPATKRSIRFCLFLLGVICPIGCSLNGENASNENDADNERFSIWCGDTPCAWEVEAGDVAQVSTWHTKEEGILFKGDPSRLSQVINIGEDTGCLVFEVMGKVEPTATLKLELDIFNDGIEDDDASIEINTLDWFTTEREIPIDEGIGTARIIIEKNGPGDVVLVEIDVSGRWECYY